MKLIKPNWSLKKATAISCLVAAAGISGSTMASKNDAEVWASKKIAPKSFDGDLRALPVVEGWKPGMMVKDMPRRRFDPAYQKPGKPKNQVLNKLDPLMEMQKQISNKALMNNRAVNQTFDGEGFTGVNPPDPTGDVGLNYYIQSINGSGGSVFSVYDKNTGNKVAGPSAMDALGSGNCASGKGDPIVLFDEMAQRFDTLCTLWLQYRDKTNG